MKTGRRRKKEEQPAKETQTQAPAPTPKKASRRSSPPRPTRDKKSQIPKGVWIVGGLFLVLVCFVMFMTVFGGRKADEWIEVTRASGEWTTTVTVMGPQVTTEERWRADCADDPQATVQATTCVMRQTDEYDDVVVDEYEEYAYNIYYEETQAQVYEARETEFVVTELGEDDWWEDDLHYVLEEELDRQSCQLTDFTTWVDDPDNPAQEIEVFLSDCEVWDHVTIYERVYEEKPWCECDVATLVEMGVESRQGSELNVRWPNPRVPAGGSAERAFEGTVTFLGGDYTYTLTTDKLDSYQSYLTDQYYIGLQEGNPIMVRRNPEN